MVPLGREKRTGEGLPVLLRRVVLAAIQIMVAGPGLLLLVGALAANQAWLDRHFLPLFFFPREKVLAQENLIRDLCGFVGFALLIWASPAIARITRRMTMREIFWSSIRIAIALGLSLAVSEMLLARKFTFAAGEKVLGEEPQRRPDPLLGWSFVPNHQGRMIAGGREIGSATDPHGYRVRGLRDPVDTARPTILFTGESIITGYGLTWEETIPAQTGGMLNLQSANMAVNGYANDQAYLRLKNELPRFQRPVAVVSLFTPALFARNLGDDRPTLDADLKWHPAIHRLRLSALFRYIVPYRSATDIEQGIAATRAVLTASAQLARRHHAVVLVVDPQFGPELPVETMLRRRILEQAGISYLRIQLDPAWRLKGDLHPSPRAARAIAAAIARALQTSLSSSGLTNQ